MRRPLPWLALAFAAGVAIDHGLAANPVAWASLSAAGLAAALVLQTDRGRRIGLVGGFVALGALLLALDANRPLPGDHVLLRHSHRDGVMVEGTLRAAPRPVGEGRWRAEVDVTLLEGPKGVAPASGGVRVTLGGAPTGVFAAGDRVRFRGRVAPPLGFRVPGAPNRAAALRRKDVEAVCWIEDPAGFVRLTRAEGRPFAAAMARRAASVRALLDDAAGEGRRAGRALIGALALGEGSALPRDVRAAFDATGTSHLLAVSGLHLGIVTALIFLLLRWLLSRSDWLLLRADVPRLAALLTIPGAWGYALLTGGAISTVRAAIMATCVLVVRALGRRGDALSGLGLAALVLLCSRPAALLEPSFQLSFIAAGAVILATPMLTEPFKFGRFGTGAVMLLAASVAASLATAPIVAWHFHRAAPLGPLANLLIVPPVAFILLPLSLALALLAPWPALAGPLAYVTIELGEILVHIARLVADIPLGSGPLPPPNVIEMATWYVALGLAWAAAKRVRWTGGLLAACLIVIFGNAIWQLTAPSRSEVLRAEFLDVGQGDATLLRLPGGGTVLVDAGGARPGAPDPGELAVSPALLTLRVRALDLLVITHPHRDHCGGARAILETFPVGEVWTSGHPGGDPECAAVLEAAALAGVPVQPVAAGHRASLGGACFAEVLHPTAPADDDLGVNDRSLVVRVDCGPGMQITLAGDVEALGEARLAGRVGARAAADVLKAPHHGSKTSSTDALLDAVRPQVAVVSVGRRNRFGQPAKAVLDRYAARGIDVRRTDLEGTISLVLTKRLPLGH